MSIKNPIIAAGYSTVADVRDATGIRSVQDASNDVVAERIKDATLRLIDDVTLRRRHVVSADKTGTVFRVGALIADTTGSGTVDAADVSLRFLKREDDGTVSEEPTGALTVDAEFGVITTANAKPNGYDALADYRVYFRELDMSRAKRAVNYMTAHLIFNRMKGPGRITRADTRGIGSRDLGRGAEGEITAVSSLRSKYMKLYRQEVAVILGGEGLLV